MPRQAGGRCTALSLRARVSAPATLGCMPEVPHWWTNLTPEEQGQLRANPHGRLPSELGARLEHVVTHQAGWPHGEDPELLWYLNDEEAGWVESLAD
jgi:hypothetical protein